MLKLLRNKRAQSTLEYAMLIAIVIAALVLMQYYMRRGIQGRAKASIESIGDQYDAEAYEAGYTHSSTTNSVDTVTAGISTSVSNTTQSIESGSYESVGGVEATSGGVGGP